MGFHLYGFSSGARTPCPKQSRPKDGGVVLGGVGTQGRSCFAHLLALFPSSWQEGVPPHILAFRTSAMAEGWGEDEIKAGIAHLQSLRAVLKRSANKVDTRASVVVSRLARTCPKQEQKACIFGGFHV